MKVCEVILPLISSNAESAESIGAEVGSSIPVVGSSSGNGGAFKVPSISEVLKKLKRNKSLEVVKEFFGFDPSQAIAVGVVAIILCRRALDDLKSNELKKFEASKSTGGQGTGAAIEKPSVASSTLSQTEAYWAVDLWGRTLALEALVTDLAAFFDSEQLGSLSSSSVRARVSGVVIGSDQLLRHLVAGLLVEEASRKSLDAALTQLKLIADLVEDARQAVVGHVRG